MEDYRVAEVMDWGYLEAMELNREVCWFGGWERWYRRAFKLG